MLLCKISRIDFRTPLTTRTFSSLAANTEIADSPLLHLYMHTIIPTFNTPPRLLRERDAVLLPKENSGVPGARDTRPLPQGMESRIPTLFSDVSDQLKNNPKQRIVIGDRSDIAGQDPAQMIRLNTVSI